MLECAACSSCPSTKIIHQLLRYKKKKKRKSKRLVVGDGGDHGNREARTLLWLLYQAWLRLTSGNQLVATKGAMSLSTAACLLCLMAPIPKPASGAPLQCPTLGFPSP
ncbi:hypothetical protein B296_00052763 [Ensete ventricosum]|uniref:Uncharacterized protein n=1 Tax=Ensete ventricosum TaxID=4639 RepID=A0A426X6T5_ENSVE|nr:hypothetical protein B296_00052763 [Ensete ventricosum]